MFALRHKECPSIYDCAAGGDHAHISISEACGPAPPQSEGAGAPLEVIEEVGRRPDVQDYDGGAPDVKD